MTVEEKPIDTLEEYELIRDGILQSLTEEQKRYYRDVQSRLAYTDRIKNEYLQKPQKEEQKARDMAIRKYHQTYDELISFEDKIGLIKVAMAYAKRQFMKVPKGWGLMTEAE